MIRIEFPDKEITISADEMSEDIYYAQVGEENRIIPDSVYLKTKTVGIPNSYTILRFFDGNLIPTPVTKLDSKRFVRAPKGTTIKLEIVV